MKEKIETKNYKRVLLKLSGESIEKNGNVISPKVLKSIYKQVEFMVNELNYKVFIVVGGGNIFRGVNTFEMGLDNNTSKSDFIGMLSTSVNSLALKVYFESRNLKTLMFNSFSISKIADKITTELVESSLKISSVIILSGGTGKPFVSTDTAAAMRAIQFNCDLILMAKNDVDGVYNLDPKKNKNAIFLPNTTYKYLVDNNIEIIDKEASVMLYNLKKNIKLIFFNMNEEDNILRIFNNDISMKKTIVTK